jgi:hypothetical protein
MELLEWEVLEGIDPFGQTRDDVRAAHLALVVAKAGKLTREDGSNLTIQDFLLEFKPPEDEAEKTEELSNTLVRWAKVMQSMQKAAGMTGHEKIRR